MVTIIREGGAEITHRGNDCFYNRVQVMNRDISTLAIQLFAEQRTAELEERAGRKRVRDRDGHASAPSHRAVMPTWQCWHSVNGFTHSDASIVPGVDDVAVGNAEGDDDAGASTNGVGGDGGGQPRTTSSPAPLHCSSPDGGWSAAVDRDAASRGLRILEALAATGLRSIRYMKEIVGVREIVVNDFDRTAVAAIKRNVASNGLDPGRVRASHADAALLMYVNRGGEEMSGYGRGGRQEMERLASGKGEGEEKTEKEKEEEKRGAQSDGAAPVGDLRDSRGVDLMTLTGERFDVIDLDPYGTAAPFLDAAVQSVSEGGLICVTCTDLAVLCGNQPEVCYSKYGAMPIKGAKYCHELALRMVLFTLEQHANRYKRFIVPQLSLSIDFYVRLFVRVYTSKKEIKRAACKTGKLYQSSHCDSFYLQPLGKESRLKHGGSKFAPARGPTFPTRCPETGAEYKLGGPLWTEPIHNRAFCRAMIDRIDELSARRKMGLGEGEGGGGAKEGGEGKSKGNEERRSARREAERVASGAVPGSGLGKVLAPRLPLKNARRIKGMVTSAMEELPHVPLFYTIGSLGATLHCTVPPLPLVYSAIRSAGFKVSGAHCKAAAIKTDAPPSVLWDVMRCWVRKEGNEVAAKRKKGKNNENSASVKILSKEPELVFNFDELSTFAIGDQLNKRQRRNKRDRSLVRYQQNPEAHWGPKAKADGGRGGGGKRAKAKAASAAGENARRRLREEAVAKEKGMETEESGQNGGQRQTSGQKEDKEAARERKRRKV